MSGQLDLDGREHAPQLTPRQDVVWQLIRQHPDGITADEAGARAHTIPGRRGGRTHLEDARCDFCASEGRRILEQLIGRGLVRRRRGGERGTGYLYVAANAGDQDEERAWAQGDLPEGF